MTPPLPLRKRAVAQWRERLRQARARLGGRFVEPVLTLVSGVAAAQAVVYATRPLLTRVYGPEEFGVLTVFIALVGLFQAFGSGHFEDALMLPARRADAARLLALSLLTSAATALLLALVIPFRGAIATALGSPALAPSLVLLPVAGLAAAWAQALETWHTRFDRFPVVSAGRVAQGALSAGVQVAAGLMGATALGLTGGAALGFAAILLPTGWVLFRRDGLLLRSVARHPRDVGTLAVRYRHFPLFTAPASLLNVLAGRIPIFGLTMLFGPGPTGLFGLAFGTLALPLGLVTGAVGQVFFVRAAEAHRHGTLAPLTRSVHRRMLAMAAYPALAAAVAGPPLFALVFGAAWAEAGAYARLLAPWIVLSAVAPPLTRLFDVVERQRTDLLLSVLQAVGLSVALGVAYRVGEPLLAVALAGAAGALLRAVQIGTLLHIAGVPLIKGLLDAVLALARTLPFLLGGILTGFVTDSVIAETTVLALGGLLYYAWAARADAGMRADNGPRTTEG